MTRICILFLEDNDDTYELIRFMLERFGHQALRAHNGKEGVEIARDEIPDLILADLSMPEMDGWEAARRLKADPATQHIPIIALTAHALPGDRQRALEAGCDAYLTKPINMPVFMQLIADFIQPKDG
jgi:CheY-like chemotaxis protein